jgi:hypothetical protein
VPTQSQDIILLSDINTAHINCTLSFIHIFHPFQEPSFKATIVFILQFSFAIPVHTITSHHSTIKVSIEE